MANENMLGCLLWILGVEIQAKECGVLVGKVTEDDFVLIDDVLLLLATNLTSHCVLIVESLEMVSVVEYDFRETANLEETIRA